MRVVLDTNVLVAAFATRGLCQNVLELCLADYTILISEFIVVELRRALKIKLKLPPALINEIIAFLKDQSEEIIPDPLPKVSFRDRSDINILALAVSGNAEVIVTGDRALQELKKFRGIPILSPRQFWQMLSR